MTLQGKLKKLYTPFLDLDCDVFHFTRGGAQAPYVVWSESGEESSFHANNKKEEQQLTGLIDFYTLTEFDPIADDIQEILYTEGIGWMLSEVQYEEETNLTHYQWRWWTVG